MGYVHKYSGWGKFLVSPGLRAEMKTRAERVKAIAASTAPVDVKSAEPGRYAASFSASVAIEKDFKGGGRRVTGRVTNDAPYAFYVEYGSKSTPKHRTLFNALIEGARG